MICGSRSVISSYFLLGFFGIGYFSINMRAPWPYEEPSLTFFLSCYQFERILLPILIGLIGYLALFKSRIVALMHTKLLKNIVGNSDIFILILLFIIYLVSPKPSFGIIISLFTGALVLACRDQGYLARKIFQNRPIQAIGTISYSIYLLHVPIVKAFSYVPFEALKIVVTVVSVLGVSALSHKYIEVPGKELEKQVRQMFPT